MTTQRVLKANPASQTAERIALVTGTSSGFGLLIAIELARTRYRVIATMRNLRSGDGTARAGRARRSIRIYRASQIGRHGPDHHRTGCRGDASSYGRIDLLVNNAGMTEIGGFTEEVSMADWRRQIDTNVIGLVAMSRAIIPAMREQRSGLIINISSISGRIGFPGYSPYATSKFAVEGFSESLRHELTPFGIRVVLVEPGAYRTSIWDKGLGQIPITSDTPYARQLDALMRYSQQTATAAPDPQQVANLIARLANTSTKRLRLRYPIGRGTKLMILIKALIPWKWFEWLVSRAIS